VRVLGVDPGLTRCGVGVVDGGAGSRLTLVHVGVVRTPAEDQVATRLLAIFEHIEALMDMHRPDRVALERMFNRHNVSTIMGTAQAAGAVAVAAARRGIPVAWHTPTEVKAAVSGSGTADKAQVGAMVTRLLRLDAMPKPADAADALALAICHLWRSPMAAKIAAAVAADPGIGVAAGGTVGAAAGWSGDAAAGGAGAVSRRR
jgi:crossover junction endodeoxyribonuclease RuvC